MTTWGRTGRSPHQPGWRCPTGSRCADALQQSRFGVAGRGSSSRSAPPPPAAGVVRWHRASRPARRARPRQQRASVAEQGGPPDRASAPASSPGASTTRRGPRRPEPCNTMSIPEPLQQVGGEPARVVPASITDSTAPNSAAASPVASASAASSIRRRRWRPAGPTPAVVHPVVVGAARATGPGHWRVSRGEPPPAGSPKGRPRRRPQRPRRRGSSPISPACRSAAPATEQAVVRARPDGRQHLLRFCGRETRR